MKSEEEEANDLFNQTILDDCGRGSIKVKMDDDEFGFEKDTDISTATENILAEIKNDCKRASTLKQRRPGNVNLEDFEIICQLGKGTFGKVYLATLPSTEQRYAIKAIRKDVLIEYDQVTSVALEKDILFEADHPFLCGMDYLFQSESRLYFVMPFINGGELYKIFQEKKRFPED